MKIREKDIFFEGEFSEDNLNERFMNKVVAKIERSRFIGIDKNWYNALSKFKIMIPKFVGRKIDYLIKSYLKKHYRLLSNNITIQYIITACFYKTNKNGDIVDRFGNSTLKRCNYYIDKNHIIRKHIHPAKQPKEKAPREPKRLVVARNEFEYWEDKSNYTYFSVKIPTSPFEKPIYEKRHKEELQNAEKNYIAAINFYYARDRRDKSDRNIKPVVVKKAKNNTRKAKTRIGKQNILIEVKPLYIAPKRTVFNDLTGLR